MSHTTKPEIPRHTVVLGGLGADSHSVSLTLLHRALTDDGINAVCLGTDNQLIDFFEAASNADMVVLFCMDGHALHHLQPFSNLRQEYPKNEAKWFLGGNPVSGDGNGTETHFLEMGFTRVFVRYVDITKTLSEIKSALGSLPKPNSSGSPDRTFPLPPRSFHKPASINLHYSHNLSSLEREQVLSQCPTGSEAADLANNAEFLASGPSWSDRQQLAKIREKPILQPRCGVVSEDEQRELYHRLVSAQADAVSYQIDPFTRRNRYKNVATVSEECSRTLVPNLTDSPIVGHRASVLRRIHQGLKIPIQCRHSGQDPRLLAEISYAGGVTAFEGGPISCNSPYFKDYPIEDAIRAWRYVDQLTGVYYTEYGIRLNREFSGILTPTLIPPSLAIATGIIESLLAAQEGVKCVSIGYAEQGNRSQDIAAIRCIEPLAQKYLSAAGHFDVRVSSVFHQYIPEFPESREKSENIILQSAATGKLAGATRILTNTTAGSSMIPSVDDTVDGLNVCYQGFHSSNSVTLNTTVIEQEEDLIKWEVSEIMDALLKLGRGDVAAGTIRSFEQGTLDIPFSASTHIHGRVLTARDCDYSIRYVDCGNLPFSKTLKDFHGEKISQRLQQDNLSHSSRYQLIERDILLVVKGGHTQWPLG